MVYPTHGAGSLCSTGIASTPWSTIGYERRHDPLLGPLDVDAFARALLAGQPTIPRYFARMRPINQAGPRLLGGRVPAIEPLAGDELDAALRAAARSSSTPGRPRPMPLAAHPGLAVDPGRPVVRDVARLGRRRRIGRSSCSSTTRPISTTSPARRLRIGVETIVGHLGGGLRAWRGSGRPVEAGTRLRRRPPGGPAGGRRTGRARRHRRPAGVRVRGRPRAGFASTSAPASCRPCSTELPRDRPIATICASGYRSSVAASMLRAAGFEQVVAVSGGLPGLAGAGYAVAYGGAEGDPLPPEAVPTGERHAH